jgi:transcription factor SFP1
MNGLRYHYQHSGDHGAVGLQRLASGKHECLAQRGDKGAGKSKGLGSGNGCVTGTAYPTTGRVGGAEREGRKVLGAAGSSS